MIYLAIIFIPPVYFLTRKKWGGFILNSILYGIACLFVLTIVFALVGVFFWILAVGHASFTYRKELVSVQADLIATKMAEKLHHQSPENLVPMKQALILITCAAALLTGCVTDNGKFPTPTANFTPKRTYAMPHERLWQAVLDGLDKNQIAVVSADKASGIIQTDYIAGPGQVMIPLGISQANRYKYNISLRDESDGTIKLNVLCKVEDTVSNGHEASQWRDVTPQNAALVNKLETWLYEQIEDELKTL